jgi:glycosyltransferase involved in cell wall biosynthesis
MMKVLLVNKFFFLNGGSERVFFQEKDFLTRNGVEVIDFSMLDPRNIQSPYSVYFVDNIDYSRDAGLISKFKNATSFVHSTKALDNLSQLLENERPDIAHLHNIYHQLTPSIIPLLKQHKVKVVLTLHDYKLVCPAYNGLNGMQLCNECHGRYFWKPFTINCQRSISRGSLLAVEAFWHKWIGSYDAVDLFIAPSDFMKKQINQRVHPSKIRILPNGIESKKYLPNYSDKGYALYFGRLSKEKGLKTLLEAHNSISDSLSLKVVGTGPLAEELKVSYPRAEFIGYKCGDELNDLITNAAFVVVPSEWYENCSMVVLEAMAFGKPVVGSRIGGIPEQIVDGKTGILFEMGDTEELAQKMLTLTNNSPLRLAMGKAGRVRLENLYDFENHGKELMKIYKSLVHPV